MKKRGNESGRQGGRREAPKITDGKKSEQGSSSTILGKRFFESGFRSVLDPISLSCQIRTRNFSHKDPDPDVPVLKRL